MVLRCRKWANEGLPSVPQDGRKNASAGPETGAKRTASDQTLRAVPGVALMGMKLSKMWKWSSMKLASIVGSSANGTQRV